VVRIDRRTCRTLGRFTVRCREAILAPDGQNVVTEQARGSLFLYRVDSGKRRCLPMATVPEGGYGLPFRPDGRRLVTVDYLIPRFTEKGEAVPVPNAVSLAWTWDVERGELLDRVRLAEPPRGTLLLSPVAASCSVSSATPCAISQRPERQRVPA
jgi:hypothetical protein